MTDHDPAGRHVIVDVWGVAAPLLDDVEWLTNNMRIGVDIAGATLVGVQDKKFEPSGVTVLMLLEESHFAIHTYPAHGYASIDCYTCGTAADPLKAVQWLVTALRPAHKQERILTRGRRES